MDMSWDPWSEPEFDSSPPAIPSRWDRLPAWLRRPLQAALLFVVTLPLRVVLLLLRHPDRNNVMGLLERYGY